ncbi:MAG TPA: 3D domain-containing protein [Chthoniobacteraceae bacterium]|nr:3D domain-containing protein [Chthoniobacteraceae bacterium]
MQKNICDPHPSRLQAARMMSRLLIAGAAVLLLSACASNKKNVRGIHSVAGGRVVKQMKVRTTAYTHTEPGGIKNGVGGRLRFKSDVRSAAADWSWMPLGTRFRMAGSPQQYVIEDYGSALVNRQTIDLYMPTRRMMNAWGVKFVDIEILEWGSKAMSLKLLEGRQRKQHVRTMVAQLRSQGVKVADAGSASSSRGRSF